MPSEMPTENSAAPSNVYQDFEHRIKKSVLLAVNKHEDEIDLSRVTVENPRDDSHGDLATNVAMVLAKPMQTNPRQLAEKIVEEISKDPDVVEATVAGPGFINLRLTPAYWQRQVGEVLKLGNAYGGSNLGKGDKINVEYVSTNPTGPIHVGHCRGAVVGDALANLLDFAGYDVTREYYVNDAGGQIKVLAQSVYRRYLEALGEDIGATPEGLYPGDYLIPVGEALAATHGRGAKIHG